MTLTTPYSASFYVGDGETKAFSFIFEELNADFVKVIVSHADGTTTVPTYTVDLDLKQVVFGDETPAPTADDVICIYRQTPTIQDTPFRTLEGYNAKALENILSKIVAMIQEIKSTYFSTQVLQGDPWQLDLLKAEDDGATVNIDYTAKKLVKGLYFKIVDGNLKVSADDSNYITMPKSVDVAEFRQTEVVLPDLSVVYKLEYRVGNTWYDAGAVAEGKAEEAIRIAEEARDIANDAKDIAQDAKDIADAFDERLTQAEQDASDAKNTVNTHIADKNNPHEVTKAQVGLGNVDNTADLDKPVIIKSATIPTASADLVGKEYQYFGETNGTYTHGFVYECVATTVTNTLILFNPVGTGKLSFDYAHHSVYELFERIAAILTTFSAEDVVSGSFTLDKVNELWSIDGYDANGDALFTNFTVSATGDEYSLDAFGFVYTFPFPDDYEEGHEEAFSIVQDTQTTYSWERVNLQPVIDNLTSTSTTAALSANQGKALNDRIDDLSGRGRFLSLWNCATGLAETNPPTSPYAYKAGDYFIVGTVSSATPAVNYKPDGSSYTTGVASTTVETNEVSVNDTYFYDGTVWKLQSNAQKEVSFSALAGSPYDNTNLGAALNAKQDALVSGTNIKTINNKSLLGAGNFNLSEQLTVLPEPTSADDARIVQYVGETIRTKHEFVGGTQGERTGTLNGYVSDTSILKTKLASINTELGIDCDRLKFVVVSNSSGYYYDVYACEGATETLYQQNTNSTSAYGIRIGVVSVSDIGTYIYFDIIYDDEYNYSGNFYKCFKKVVVGEKPSAMYVAITNLDLVNSKIAEANETFGITTAKLKFVLTMMGNSQFTVYAVEGDGTEHLMQADINTGNLPTTFGVQIAQTGTWTVGMYTELEYQYYWNEVLELAHLGDVELKGLEDGQALIYDAASDKWVNGKAGVTITYNAQTEELTIS